jgi:hypothetical protein
VGFADEYYERDQPSGEQKVEGTIRKRVLRTLDK